MKAGVVIFLLIVMTTIKTYGQKEIDENTPWSFRDRAYTGLGFGGLSFGNHPYYGSYFSAGLSAVEGFMLTKHLSTGIGVQYNFTSYSKPKAQTHLLGGYPFLRCNIRNFFIQADYSMYQMKGDYVDSSQRLADRFLVGAGYYTPGRPGLNFMIAYDLLYTNTGPWGTPVTTRLFFTF
jgi:hypothetical protein